MSNPVDPSIFARPVIQGGSTHRDQIMARWPWGPVGQKFLYPIGLMLDVFEEALRQGMNDHMPGRCSPDSLAPIGNDRMILRGPDESYHAYSLRLQQAFDMWALAGNAWSLFLNLAGLIAPVTTVIRTVTNLGTWDSYNDPNAPLTGTPTWRIPLAGNWQWDSQGDPFWYSFVNVRTWVIIVSNGAPWNAANLPVCGSGIRCGSGQPCGWAGTQAEAQALSAVAALFKQAGVVIPWIIVTYSGSYFQPTLSFGSPFLPDGHWGHWGRVLNGRYVAARPTGMSFIDGART